MTTHQHRLRVGADFDATAAAVQAGLRLFPHTFMSRVFAEPGHGVPSWGLPQVAALTHAGVRVHKSFKDWDEAALVADWSAMPAGVEFGVYTYWHEAQDDPIDPKLFAWRTARVATLRDQHPNRDRIRCGPIFNWWPVVMNGVDWRPYVDGIDPGDFISWDIYPNTLKKYADVGKVLATPIASADATGLPLWVSEVGSLRTTADTDGKGCAAWMSDFLDGLRQGNAQRVQWWQAHGSTAAKDYRLDHRAPELAVWQAADANQ